MANSDCESGEVGSEDLFRYYDDINMLKLIIFCEKLRECDVFQDIPSDVQTGQKFLPSTEFKMQNSLNSS